MLGFNPLQVVYGVVALVIVTAVGGYIYHCEAVKTEYAEFKAVTKSLGEEAERRAKKKEAADKLAKEKSDAENNRLTADNAALARKLRDARSRGGYLPAPAPTSTNPNRASFDRTELERTLQRLDDGVSSVVAEGDAARIGLDSARDWAKDTTPRE